VKTSCRVKVKNPQGLHARPASVIVRLLQESRSEVHFTCKKATVNARSIMSLLTLAASKNSQILIEVEGEDAENTLEKLVHAFEEKFGESDQYVYKSF
jgi:phosphocarrier protein HPr